MLTRHVQLDLFCILARMHPLFRVCACAEEGNPQTAPGNYIAESIKTARRLFAGRCECLFISRSACCHGK